MTKTPAKLVLVLVAAVLALSGTALAASINAEPPIKSRAEVLGTLPCFNCHGLEGFLHPKEGPGIFSHDAHSDTGLHCNHCHSITGHSPPALLTEQCGRCHSLKEFSYSGGGYGTVMFNHEYHDSAFSCDQCHPDPFPMKRGATDMPMGLIYKGRLCGKCHDGRMAFDARQCMKCHNMGG